MGNQNQKKQTMKTIATTAALALIGQMVNAKANQTMPQYLAQAAAASQDVELYNIEDEKKIFNGAVESLDNTWDNASEQIEWYETVPISFANFVGTFKQVQGPNKFMGTGEIVINADGSFVDGDNKEATAWYDGRRRIAIMKSDTDQVKPIGSFVDGYLKVE